TLSFFLVGCCLLAIDESVVIGINIGKSVCHKPPYLWIRFRFSQRYFAVVIRVYLRILSIARSSFECLPILERNIAFSTPVIEFEHSFDIPINKLFLRNLSRGALIDSDDEVIVLRRTDEGTARRKNGAQKYSG